MSNLKMLESIQQLGHQEMVSRHWYLKQKHQKVMANILMNNFSHRELILHGGSIDTSFALDRRNLINQISSVGNNINQLTRLANTNKLVSDSILKQEVDLLKEIPKLMMEVIKKWR